MGDSKLSFYSRNYRRFLMKLAVRTSPPKKPGDPPAFDPNSNRTGVRGENASPSELARNKHFEGMVSVFGRNFRTISVPGWDHS